MECMKDIFQKDQLLDGRFRTIAPLNHGSFGMVFLAHDLQTHQQVAIKCLTRPGATASSAITIEDEGAEELNCHAVLKEHPYLVNLVHHFDTRAHTYLVLEYCSQGDLYEAIRVGRGPLETEHVRRFMLQLINAVDHMHSHGLYHRDIKPENIFLTADGSMKLGDFGLATRHPWSHESCVGSDRYMAPEQYDSAGVGYDPAKADIWSIGICLLNVLFSKNPFVTPTDSDVLFADYRRDRQSLYDIFPSMSQDTFEVLSIAMALDPTKRDLAALRLAISQALEFTTDDDDLDDFCTESRNVVLASANREPLRTPSIQSPQVNSGDSFPWAKALNVDGRRQLSAIPDNESYDEDLFAASEKGLNLAESWFSGHANTPSLASVLGSAFSGSFKSMAIRRPIKNNPPRPGPITVPSSLPAHAARPIPAMSSIFGKKDTIAKSWSEMFDEDAEESEREQEELTKRREHNSRTWSHESRTKVAVRPGILTETKSHSSINARRNKTPQPISPIKTSPGLDENDPLSYSRAKRSPTKLISTDKWAALGNKRRNLQAESITPKASVSDKRRSMTMGSRGVRRHENSFHRRESREKARPYLDKDWRQHKPVFDSSTDDEDYEWVGGWQTFHL